LDGHEVQPAGVIGKFQIERNHLPASVQPDRVRKESSLAARSVDCEGYTCLAFRTVGFNLAEGKMAATSGSSSVRVAMAQAWA